MAYIVSARKYRPQTFEEVIGQEHVTSTIKNALLSDKLAHAFLFCGPRGVGKTTCARLLAKVINMPDPKLSLTDGSYADHDIDISLNIVELDAASNNSVENIRSLIDQVRVQPQQGKYKVFIIDEVHMLSQAAFNAFLKTLEEPPAYAIFILATTERHKILPTILSRCQLYDFRRIQIPDIITQLESIAEKENISVEYDALYVIAEKADGAMRDALSIFDRMASASTNKITVQSVIDNLNILDFETFFQAVDCILREDAPELLLLFDRVLKNGFEGDHFMNGLAQHMRNLLYSKQEPTQSLLQMSEDLKTRYLNQARAISFSTLLTGLNIANSCDLDYSKAKDKRLHVEISLLKLCYSSRAQLPDSGSDASAPSLEKKTSITNPAPSSEKGLSHLKPTDVATGSEPTEEESSIEQMPGDSTESNPAVGSDSDKNIMINTPSLSSINDIIKEAEEEIAQNGHGPKPLLLEEVEEVWSSYVNGVESSTTSNILTNVLKELKDDKIIISVPSNIAREEIQQETDLFTSLREHFNQNDLMIEVFVDREKFPDVEDMKPKKLFTSKEKYDHLKSINPLVDDLINDLDLKLET